jgi:hypothetical protein
MNPTAAAELKKHKQAWKKPAPRYTRGVLAKYAAQVTSASLGAVRLRRAPARQARLASLARTALPWITRPKQFQRTTA